MTYKVTVRYLGWNRQFGYFPAIFCSGKCDPRLGQCLISALRTSITNTYSTASLCVGYVLKHWCFLAAIGVADTPKAPNKQNPEGGEVVDGAEPNSLEPHSNL